MSESADDKILLKQIGDIAYLVFNNPTRHNAVSLAMWRRVNDYLQTFADNNPAVRVLVLCGAGGKAFVSGADISRFEDERADTAAVTEYNAQTRKVRVALRDQGQYDERMLTLLRKIRCSKDATLAECTAANPE